MRLAPVGSLLVCLVACHGAPSLPVPVGGDVSALAGEWEGDYNSKDGTRHGVIDFRLQAGSDTAYGDVMMSPRVLEQVAAPDDRSGRQREAMSPRLLSIRFVRISGGELSGDLDPHVDPDCDCTLNTVFRGKLVADTLKGRYVSRDHAGEVRREGRWRVVRKPLPH